VLFCHAAVEQLDLFEDVYIRLFCSLQLVGLHLANVFAFLAIFADLVDD